MWYQWIYMHRKCKGFQQARGQFIWCSYFSTLDPSSYPRLGKCCCCFQNPGGTKRVTALADSLKINFAMIHTDRRRTQDEYAKKKELKQAQIIEEGEDNIVSELQTARVVQGHVVDDDYQANGTSEHLAKEGILTVTFWEVLTMPLVLMTKMRLPLQAKRN